MYKDLLRYAPSSTNGGRDCGALSKNVEWLGYHSAANIHDWLEIYCHFTLTLSLLRLRCEKLILVSYYSLQFLFCCYFLFIEYLCLGPPSTGFRTLSGSQSPTVTTSDPLISACLTGSDSWNYDILKLERVTIKK